MNKILQYPSPFLRQPTKICEPGETLQNAVKEAWEILINKENGAALSANQIGIGLRFFVVNKDKLLLEDNLKEVLSKVIINPIISNFSEKKEIENEGCLSFPGITIPIIRSKDITVEYLDLDFNNYVIDLHDFSARVFQHEIEHLDGKLFVDHLTTGQKFDIVKKLKKGK